MTKKAELAQQSAAGLTEAVPEHAISVMPRVDIYENSDELLVVADMPGVPSDALSLRLDGSELRIEGVQPKPEQNGSLQPLAFSRAFRVPDTVDSEGVTAELSRGVLRVHLAKSAAAKPRTIEVRAS